MMMMMMMMMMRMMRMVEQRCLLNFCTQKKLGLNDSQMFWCQMGFDENQPGGM